MARRFEMTEEQWDRIAHLLPGKPGDPGATARDNRLFVDAVLWIARTGAGWRDLPERFGPWQTVYHRFCTMRRDGTIDRILGRLQARLNAEGLIDAELFCIDGTVIRASRAAAGQGGRPSAYAAAPLSAARSAAPWARWPATR